MKKEEGKAVNDMEGKYIPFAHISRSSLLSHAKSRMLAANRGSRSLLC